MPPPAGGEGPSPSEGAASEEGAERRAALSARGRGAGRVARRCGRLPEGVPARRAGRSASLAVRAVGGLGSRIWARKAAHDVK